MSQELHVHHIPRLEPWYSLPTAQSQISSSLELSRGTTPSISDWIRVQNGEFSLVIQDLCVLGATIADRTLKEVWKAFATNLQR
jgi:hypothetical protein